jgi:ATP-dependent Clp protease ATP-binding subunit ClpC
MANQLTQRAHRVLALAKEEATRTGASQAQPEHVLLGLILEGSGVGPCVLRELGVDLHHVRQEVEDQLAATPHALPTAGAAEDSTATKQLLLKATEESANLPRDYVGTEHIVLGILHERDGLAARVLRSHGIELDGFRHEVLKVLNQ